MNNFNENSLTNDVKNISEETIVLAPPEELRNNAKQIALNTTADKKFPFVIIYDANQKSFLFSMLQDAGVVINKYDEENYKVHTLMNMTQLAFIKSLDGIKYIEEETSDSISIQENNTNTMQSNELYIEQSAIIEPAISNYSVENTTINLDIQPNNVEMTSVSSTNAHSNCPDNSSMESAMTILPGISVACNICCPGAEEWFKFTVNKSDRYTIFTTGGLDTIGTLYDSCGTQLSYVDDYSPCGQLNFRIIRNLTAGNTYYIKVKAFGNRTGNYILSVTTRVLVDYVTINHNDIILEKGKTYELPITPNYTYRGYDGAEKIDGLSIVVSPSDSDVQRVEWSSTSANLEISKGWDDEDNRYVHIIAKESGTATLKATDINSNGKSDTCTVSIVTPYEKQLLSICSFSKEVTMLILKVYDRIETVFASESTIMKAWICARLLSEFYYDYESYGINKWDKTAGSVTTDENRETFFLNTLGYSKSEYDALSTGLTMNKSEADEHNKLLDFLHMQYSLSARIAYELNKDDLFASNIGSGFFTGNFDIYTDEEVSYLAGWLGDAVLTNFYGTGTNILKNDDYMADLDAENIYRLITQGHSSLDAINEYYSNMTSSNTRAHTFLQHISYDTVKQKIFNELIDKNLYRFKTIYLVLGNHIKANHYQNLIDDEEYHFNTIKSKYPDTYNFLKSLYDGLSTMEYYTDEL